MSEQSWHTPDKVLELPDPLEAEFLTLSDEAAEAAWVTARGNDVGTAGGWLKWAGKNKR